MYVYLYRAIILHDRPNIEEEDPALHIHKIVTFIVIPFKILQWGKVAGALPPKKHGYAF